MVKSGGCCHGDVRWVWPWQLQVGVALVTSGACAVLTSLGVAVATSGGCCSGDVRSVLPWCCQVGVSMATSAGCCHGDVRWFLPMSLQWQR